MTTPSPNGHHESGRSILLRAAADLPTRFTFEELVVAAWMLSPTVFGLRGFDMPDSRKVAVLVHGAKGVVALGLLRKVGKRYFKLAKRPSKPKTEPVDELEVTEHALEILDGIEPDEVEADEYQRLLSRAVQLRQELPDKVRERRNYYCKHGQRFDECAACSPNLKDQP